jgi:hypothetical protein
MGGKTHAASKRREKKKQKKKAAGKGKGWRTARESDIHELYEKSVQEPEAECDLIDQVWAEHRDRKPGLIREDFCGTAAVAMEWIRRRKSHEAIGVDLDEDVLDWGRAKIPERLPEEHQVQRLTLIKDDVMTVHTPPVDSLLAMNFSYFLFKTRAEVVAYFKRAFAALVDDGIMLLDAYGGSDSYLEMEEERHFDGFTYVWDQAHYNPITNDVINHIHFRFPDGSEITNAFTYEWRLWSIPEIREMLLEAGFASVHVYWEGTDEDSGEGNGVWEESTTGEACQGWVAYIAAMKN